MAKDSLHTTYHVKGKECFKSRTMRHDMHDRRNVIYFSFRSPLAGYDLLSLRADGGADDLFEPVDRAVAGAVFPGASEAGLHMWLRKLAHIGVYFVEGALLFLALRRSLRGAGKGFLATLALCALIAEVDEAHKALIPGRHCSWDEEG